MRRTIILRVAGVIVACIVAFNVAMALIALMLRRIPSIGDETSDEIALAAAGRGIELKSRAAAFRGGSARAIMGGVEILVPESWPLRIAATRVRMGGTDYPEHAETVPDDLDDPVLELSLHAVMGGIEVKARAPDSDTQTAPSAER